MKTSSNLPLITVLCSFLKFWCLNHVWNFKKCRKHIVLLSWRLIMDRKLFLFWTFFLHFLKNGFWHFQLQIRNSKIIEFKLTYCKWRKSFAFWLHDWNWLTCLIQENIAESLFIWFENEKRNLSIYNIPYTKFLYSKLEQIFVIRSESFVCYNNRLTVVAKPF